MKDAAKRIKDANIRLPDGRMHYQSLGSGSPVVLLHSMGSSVWSWSNVMEPLARKHAVYVLDTMGQGDSDKPSRDYTIKDYADSVLDFMKAKGISKTALIGNSVGAVIAVQVAAANAAMVEKLVLVGCPCRETVQERQEALIAFKTRYDDAGIPLPRSLEDLKEHFVHVSLELQAKVNEDWAKSGVWAWKCSIANSNFDIVPALKRITARTLVVFGEKDMLRAKEKALQSYIKGSKRLVIPDAGHLPQVDNPEAFLSPVKRFLG